MRSARRIVVTFVVVPMGDAAPPRAAPITAAVETNRHPTVTWTLRSGVESDTIEIAISPAAGTDGGFLTENLAMFDLLEKTQTNYVSTDRFDPGLYWVHVKTFDNECSYLENNTCFAWSAAVRFAMPASPNRRPTLRFLRWERSSGEPQMRVCDDTATGQPFFRTTLKRDFFGQGTTIKRRVYPAYAPPTFEDGATDCETYGVPLPKLYGVARYTMTMTYTDGRGATSKPVVNRWVVTD